LAFCDTAALTVQFCHCNRKCNRLLLEVGRKRSRSLFEVPFIHDIVSIEDTPGLMARNGHCDFFWYACADHIPHSRAPEVMGNLSFPDKMLFTGLALTD
jgi:hypothetical protein